MLMKMLAILVGVCVAHKKAGMSILLLPEARKIVFMADGWTPRRMFSGTRFYEYIYIYHTYQRDGMFSVVCTLGVIRSLGKSKSQRLDTPCTSHNRRSGYMYIKHSSLFDPRKIVHNSRKERSRAKDAISTHITENDNCAIAGKITWYLYI